MFVCLFVCFTICLFISPDLDGHRAPKKSLWCSAHALLITKCAPLIQAPLIKVISIYEHEWVGRVPVPEWTARSQNRYIIG